MCVLVGRGQPYAFRGIIAAIGSIIFINGIPYEIPSGATTEQLKLNTNEAAKVASLTIDEDGIVNMGTGESNYKLMLTPEANLLGWGEHRKDKSKFFDQDCSNMKWGDDFMRSSMVPPSGAKKSWNPRPVGIGEVLVYFKVAGMIKFTLAGECEGADGTETPKCPFADGYFKEYEFTKPAKTGYWKFPFWKAGISEATGKNTIKQCCSKSCLVVSSFKINFEKSKM